LEREGFAGRGEGKNGRDYHRLWKKEVRRAKWWKRHVVGERTKRVRVRGGRLATLDAKIRMA